VSSSYSSWIYNYLCNQCISLLVSSNPSHGEVYSIQHYVINFVSDLQQFGDFCRVPCEIIIYSIISLNDRLSCEAKPIVDRYF
jgi:hypothetical protein